MHDPSTHLLLARLEQPVRQHAAAQEVLALRVAALRRLDRRARVTAARARLVRLALS